jgi:hypothetical protein
MAQENYVERVLSSLSSQTREDLRAHLSQLDAILDQIDNVPSPEKESLLVKLVLRGRGKPSQQDRAQSSV